MSIPGLGQIPTQPAPSATRTIRLRRFWEWRFQVSSPPITVRLLSGTAERDGTELALNQPYVFSHTKSKLFTWQGCEVEVDGACDEHVAQLGGGGDGDDDSPMVSYMNLHLLLAAQRKAAAARGGHGGQGPRVMVCGPRDCGQTALCRTLAAWGVKMGQQTCMVNAEPREGMLSLPGTLSAAVYATVVDLEGEGSGWGGTPSSGPSAVPVKLPLVYYHGYQRAQDDAERFNVLATRLAGAVTGRMLEDPDVRSAGLIIDAPVVNLDRPDGIEVLAHLVEEFSVNIVVVLGSDELNQALLQRLAAEKTSLGEPISVVKLEQSSGAVERDEAFLQHIREATIKEYFFGDAKRTLSPLTQQADFDGLTVYKTPEPASSHHGGLEKVDNPSSLSHWTLAIMNASPHDSTETIQNATVMGFVYVADVDAERRRLKILAPVSGRLGDRPLVWGRWPEPYINLLG